MNDQIQKLYPSPTATYEQVVQSSQLFWEKLKDFHTSFKTKFSIPTVGGKALNLHRLFIEVTTRGGFEKVVADRKWKEVVVAFNFPTTITSGSFVLRKYYTSLLYHFEQLYYFRKQFPPHDPACKNDSDDGGVRKQSPGEVVSMELQAGYSVKGTIDGKFDNGYLITVDTGSEQLKGVLYHVPQKKSRKSRKSGYNIFFAEQFARLKPIYGGQEKAMSKEIGLLWNDLSGAEKKVYQEKGVRDKERLKNETP